jgi:hypothetical protein
MGGNNEEMDGMGWDIDGKQKNNQKKKKKKVRRRRWWLFDNVCPLTEKKVIVVTSSGSETFLPAKQNLRATATLETRAKDSARSKKQKDGMRSMKKTRHEPATRRHHRDNETSSSSPCCCVHHRSSRLLRLS